MRFKRKRQVMAAQTVPGTSAQRALSPLEIFATTEEWGRDYLAFVYLGPHLVFEVQQPVSEFPAGIEDFANWVEKMLARRLQSVLQPDPDGDRMSAEVATGLRGY